MRIGEVVTNDLPRVSPHDSVISIEAKLLEAKAAVVEDEERYKGLLTLADVVERAHLLVIDCLVTKPALDPEDELDQAIALMESQGVHTLPVKSHGRFLGVVSYKAIVESQERQRRKLATYAARLEHYEALRQMASGVAHDFNNLAHIIFFLLDRARSVEGAPEELLCHLAHAENVVERTTGLAEQLRNFARHGNASRERLALEAMIRENAELLTKASDVGLVFDFSAELWDCEVEHDRFAQVITNLIINAVHACADRTGQLELSGRNVVVTDRDELPLPSGHYVALGFHDNGVGVAPEDKERIFAPYFTTKETGTGLGLSLVATIVNDHGGYVAVESALGEGTTFTVYLPALSSDRAGG